MPPGDALLAALYDSVVEDSALDRALDMLARQFHCPSACLLSFDAVLPQADILAAVGVFGSAEVQRTYNSEWGRWIPPDPLSPRCVPAAPARPT